ncbi:MAG: DUF4163 domain-containing protein, partial [Agathobacter sp.]|nr:DUF4163 domain-containing protein [Agathobacter sp.]
MQSKKTLALIAATLFLSACQFSGQDISDEGKNSLPLVRIESTNIQRYTEDGETQLVEINKDNMTLSGDGYEKAAETVRKLFYNTEEELSKRADDLAEMAMDQYMAAEEQNAWFTPYGFSTSYELARLDTNVLSIKGNSYSYEGGIHG